MKKKKSRKLEIREVPEKDFYKPDYVLDLEKKLDSETRRNKKWIFQLSMFFLTIAALIIVRTEPVDMPDILDKLIPVMTFVLGWWLGKKK